MLMLPEPSLERSLLDMPLFDFPFFKNVSLFTDFREFIEMREGLSQYVALLHQSIKSSSGSPQVKTKFC